jgi:hypothetical protein
MSEHRCDFVICDDPATVAIHALAAGDWMLTCRAHADMWQNTLGDGDHRWPERTIEEWEADPDAD